MRRVHHEFYDGLVRVDEQHDVVEADVPKVFADALGTDIVLYRIDFLIHDARNGDGTDRHEYWLAGGKALRKVRKDFRELVAPAVPVKLTLKTMRDPVKDGVGERFNRNDYVVVEKAGTYTMPVTVRFRCPRKRDYFECKFRYAPDGTLMRATVRVVDKDVEKYALVRRGDQLSWKPTSVKMRQYLRKP